ncbi:hypothetical protein MSPP1_000839 [Malassezia sp. CBS 17886]|nr:hypothetical protein MSPP1_000839 [Malassezia sp. CBS 17886]
MLQDRGFTLGHQRVAVELDLSGALAGYTELTISPTTQALRQVHVNARRAHIQRVLCNGHEATFRHTDVPPVPPMTDIHAHPQLKRALFASASAAEEGELEIALPGAAWPVAVSQDGDEGYEPVVVRIEYLVEDVQEAIQVVRPTAEAPYRVPHMYTRALGPGSARCWVPCVDTLWDRCTWELEFIVPRVLEGADGDAMAAEVYVVCSGELVEHAAHPQDAGKAVFYYTQPVATKVQHIAFCAGPLVLRRVSPRSAEGCEVLAFCLPEHEHELLGTVAFTWQAIEYIAGEYGSYPFGSFKMVFVDDAVADCHSASTLAVCSSDLLHPVSVIDQAFENRHILSHAVAFQWVGINIVPKTWADTWLVHGLSQHLAAQFLRRLLGSNEYRFRLKKDCDRLCAWDVGMPPLYQNGREEPLDAQLLPFVNLKAPLVLYLLDRRLCKMGASVGLARVIPKLFLQAITGELAENALGTHSFLRLCKKVSGADLRQFVDQWINGSGCPRFLCTATFNRKKLLIEMHVRQESPAALFAQAHPEDALASNPVALWEGQMTVRIHEADGTPYEHVLDIKSEHQRYDVPFNTKYKRVRRNTKRFQARQAAAAAAAAGDEDAAEAIGMIDLGFGLGMWEDEEERKHWRVADWTEEDEAIMASAPYEWIRLDADFEWMATIQFEQPDYMWVSQLQRDRDVVAQLTAVHALSQLPSLITSSMLTRTVLVTKYFYRIRAEAAHGLANCALPHLDLLGLFHLLMLFRTGYCIPVPNASDSTALDAPCIPKPNDFSDMADYFVRRALVHAIASIRDRKGKALPIVQHFLITILRYNDNSTNRFVDDYYIAGIINALAGTLIPADTGALAARTPGVDDEYSAEETALRELASREVERLQELDRLVPSFHNVVTLASMDFQLALTFANLRAIDLPYFLEYTRAGNFAPVRMHALNALLLLGTLQHKVLTRYYFALLATDESERIRMHLAGSLCDALAVALATGELGYTPKRVDERSADGALQEHDDAVPPDELDQLGAQDARRHRDEALQDAMIRHLRREIGRSASVREGFLTAMRASASNAGVRGALLRLAELLFRPTEEARVPGVAASVPVQEAVPAGAEQSGAQRIKLMIKNAPAQRSGGPPPHPPPPALKVVLPKTARAKKAKAPEPGQALGMSSSDLTACRNCIQRLMANKHCEPFVHPVDPVRDEAPDYFDVIKDPMDLSSVSNKLQSGQYRDRFQFKDDVELIFRNAKTYTPDPKTWIHYEASRSESVFRQLWNRITKTLEQAAAKAAAAGKHEDAAADAHPADTEPHAPGAEPHAADAEPRAASVELRGASAQPPGASEEPPGASEEPTVPPGPAPPKRLKIKLSRAKGEASATGDSPASTPDPTPAPDADARGAVKRRRGRATDEAQRAPEPAQGPPPPALHLDPEQAHVASMDPVLPGETEMPLQPGKCRSVLHMLMKTKEAAIFLHPIDPVRDNAPTYYDEIKYPMDLGTVERKLGDGSYRTMGDFAADVRLMFANCRQFNPPGTAPAQMEAAASRVWRREWSRAMLKQHPAGGLFLYAVDPVALGVPTYFDVIPKKNARDLTLISDKLRTDKYDSVDALDADIQLMLSNCYTFNASDERVCDVARAFEKAYRQEVHSMRNALDCEVSARAHGAKRKDTPAAGDRARKKSHT